MKLYIVNLLLSLLPPSRCFSLKRFLLRWAGVNVGRNVRVMRIQVWGVNVEIGDNTFIGNDTFITGASGTTVRIGKNCDISDRVNILTGTHRLGTKKQAAGEGYGEDVSIGDGVWIGLGATIMPGVTIGNGTVVAACSCVKDNVGEYSLVAGVPAKYKKSLFES